MARRAGDIRLTKKFPISIAPLIAGKNGGKIIKNTGKDCCRPRTFIQLPLIELAPP